MSLGTEIPNNYSSSGYITFTINGTKGGVLTLVVEPTWVNCILMVGMPRPLHYKV